MFANRVSDLTGGPGFLHIAGTLWKKGQRMGYVKRYMSITTQQFTYYSKGGDSFPLGFMDTHDILLVKEVENKAGRRFDVVANGQVLKLMAPSKEEAEMWVKTIRAIVDAVKHSKFATSKLKRSDRRNMIIPQWKKNFWDEHESKELTKKMLFRDAHKLSTSFGGISTLFKTSLERPRLLKKLLTWYDDDVKLLKLMIEILLKNENLQRPIEDVLKAHRIEGDEDLRSDTKSHQTTQANMDKSRLIGGKRNPRSKIKKKAHRRSRSGEKWTVPRFQKHIESSSELVRSSKELVTFSKTDYEDEEKNVNFQKKRAPTMWFYMDEKATLAPLITLTEAMKSPEKIGLFKTYLKSHYQDGNIMFLCDAKKFEKLSEEKDTPVEDLKREGQQIFEKYIKLDADISIDPAERERRKIRQTLQSADPRNAFGPVLSRIHALVEEQFAEYIESDFYEKISISKGPIEEGKLCQKIETGEVSGSTLVWKDGTKISLWKKAESIPAFSDALFDKNNQGELTPDETRHLFDWIVTRDGAIQMLAEGVSSNISIVRGLSHRVLFLYFRACYGYDDANPIVLSQSFTKFVRKAKFILGDVMPINVVLQDHFFLMAMMFNEVSKFDCDFKEGKSLKPGRIIWNYSLWQAVFDNLYGSDIYPRIKCLQDAYYHILTNKPCALALLTMPNWQSWFLPLAFDVPSKHQSASISKMKTYIIAMIVHLLWTCVEQKGFVAFAQELRMTIALTLSVCGDASGSLITEILSSTASRFHTDCQKWIKLDDGQQVERYKCAYHLVRLIISMALNISGRRFGQHDHLRTHKILPKEFPERHHTRERRTNMASSHGTSAQNNLSHVAEHIDTGRRDSGSSRRASFSLDPRSQASQGGDGSVGGGPTPKEAKSIYVCNDQQLLYILKVYYHTRECEMRVRSSRDGEGVNESSNFAEYQSPRAIYNTLEVPDAYCEEGMQFRMTAASVQGLLSHRLDELKKSIANFGDSDHIAGDDNFKGAAKLHTYNSPWHSSLKGYHDALTKLQTLLIDLKQQDLHLQGRHESLDQKPLDPKTKRCRMEVLNLLSFVNDSVGFLDLMEKKLWKLLNVDQVRDLVSHFVEASDPIRRRKVFHGWEKERKKNEAKLTKELERQLKAEEERRKKTSTILLIGPGQSGKSTVFKQLTILHGKGFSDNRRRQYRKQIYTNIVGALKNLIAHANLAARRSDESIGDMSDELGIMHEILGFLQYNDREEEAARVIEHIKCLNDINGLGERYRGFLLEAATDEAKLKKALQVKKEIKVLKSRCTRYSKEKIPKLLEEFYSGFKIDKKNRQYANIIAEAPFTDIDMSGQLKEAIKRLWRDKAIRSIYRRRQRFKKNQLDDSAVYMLQHIDRILSTTSYMPTSQDIIHCRQRTLGIVEGEFEINKQIFKIVDVAGQRGARTKWIPLFECANACLFVCSLAGYNRYLLEDKDKLRIHEALQLFDDIVNQKALSRVPIIVFLNK